MNTVATNGSAVKGKKARKKPERHLWWSPTRTEGVSLLTLQVGKDVDTYIIRRILADFGQGFSLHKQTQAGDGEVYHVNLDGLAGSCECKGFLRWQKPCKHIDAVVYLLGKGKDI